MDEKELSIKCAQNNTEARKQLYDAYSAHLYRVCMRYAANREEALDLLHDAFIKIYAQIGKFSYRGSGSLKWWLTRLTVNLIITSLRSRAKLKIDSNIPDNIMYEEPSEHAMSQIPVDVIMQFIEELPAGYRTVFNLYVFEEMSHKEIAVMLQINEKSSSSQLLRAKAALAKKITDYINRFENGKK